MTYRELFGWKYELLNDAVECVELPYCLAFHIDTDYIGIAGDYVVVRKRYAWNGPNVVPDSPDLMRASMFHDALYQLMREGYISKKNRRYADRLFRDIYIREATRIVKKKKGKVTWADKLRIKAYSKAIYRAVRIGGGFTLNKSEYPDGNVFEV